MKHKISKSEYSLLHQLLSMKDTSLLKSLPKIMEKYYPKESIHATAEYIYIEGEIPIALIAHLDTVFTSPPHVIYHDDNHGVIWSPDGLGSDDRAGVFAIMQIVAQGYRPSIVFTMGEERGGKGAFILTDDIPKPLTDINFMIELDRKGTNDAVYYDCGNAEFEDYISSFGFQTAIGTFSDIMIIGPVWDRAAVNLSIGYYNEHTFNEYLNYYTTLNTIKRVEHILNNYTDQVFTYRQEDPMMFGDFWFCDSCGKAIDIEDIITITKNGLNCYLCKDCFNLSKEWGFYDDNE